MLNADITISREPQPKWEILNRCLSRTVSYQVPGSGFDQPFDREVTCVTIGGRSCFFSGAGSSLEDLYTSRENKTCSILGKNDAFDLSLSYRSKNSVQKKKSDYFEAMLGAASR